MGTERGNQINNFLRQFDKRRNAIEPHVESREKFNAQVAKAKEQKPKFSNAQIASTINDLRTAQFKKSNRYNTYAQIGALAALGFTGFAVWKGSKKAAGAAVVCASVGIFCFGKKYQLAQLSQPTREDATRFLEQQK